MTSSRNFDWRQPPGSASTGDAAEAADTDLVDPVDPQTFSFAARVYQAAAALQLPSEHLVHRLLVQVDGEFSELPETPFNRGMATALHHLLEMQVADPQTHLQRLVNLHALLRQPQLLGDLVSELDGQDFGRGLVVSDALVYAAATSRMHHRAGIDEPVFDVEDILATARGYGGRAGPG